MNEASLVKVCIVGAGAIGGWIGALLARAGEVELSVLARGATLEAVQQQGLRLDLAGERISVPVEASNDAAALGPQDLVVLAVKGPALAAVAPAVAQLLGLKTRVLVAMNGVPWWFFHGMGGEGEGWQLESVDPGGRIAALIPAERVIGCVVHASCSVTEPGLVQHKMGAGLILGLPAGGLSPELQAWVELLRRAGFEASASERIQRDIWFKLWGNMTFNPISALTGATGDRILADELVLGFVTRVMREASAIGARIGCAIEQTPEQRHEVTRKLGAFRTSMLQDVEAGRPLELDALVGAVREIGQRLGMATPDTDALLGLARLMARSRGLYQ
ncbi:2-dehydropantoate 2-reductase [Pelomonas sp. SE-A7]|uniref:2-dehydropantoate 2-reductase n=1 Tax=Pelomonas sp. SE-A7 TaxID=3054953 RepID=UPI00259CF3E4|nr:2-dehydropantoate 2-reductase [Pelomonas sp. SE-A7]MDM4768044.1 2-dehydropantoate 2-reductase [Pelomonas sp. SE-A7]